MQALDYSLARPDPAAAIAAGYVGVLRYLAPTEDAPKVITAVEYENLRGHGLKVALNWEWYGNRAREGAAAGTADAQEALRQANELGYTGAIYFSVDYDAAPADQPAINAYFQACAAVIGLERLGAYAGYWPLSRLFDAGLIHYGWQTFAWSGGNREARAHLYQNGETVFDGGADVNDILKPDWTGGSMNPGAWDAMQCPQYSVQNDGTLQGSNGQTVYGWILDSMRRILASPNNLALFGVLYGLPTSGQTQDTSGNWWQSFEHIRVRVNGTNKDDYGFAYVPAQTPVGEPLADAAKAAMKAWLAS